MAEELVKEICSLKGEKLEEIFNGFRLLLRDKNEIINQNIDDIVNIFNPQDHLQKLFKLKLIDRYEQYDQVYKILISEDTFYVSHALKFDWFFKEIRNCKAFFDEFLPSMSFCTRTRVIEQYSKHLTNQDIIEHLFLTLNQKYNINLAFILLPACSEKFVRDTLPTFQIQPPQNVLNSIFNLYPDLIKIYLDGITKHKRAFKNFQIERYQNVFLKLASEQPELFMDLFENYNSIIPNIKLGLTTSNRIIKFNTSRFTNNFEKYSEIIRTKTLTECMSIKDIEKLQLALCPKSISEFFKGDIYSHFISILSCLQRELRAKILMTNFEKAYGKQLTYEEFSSVLTFELVQFLPVSILSKWIESIIPTEHNLWQKTYYISCLPVSSSFPKLQELMEINEGSTKELILERMFYSMTFNNDTDIIPEIINCFLSTVRNNSDSFKQIIVELKGLEDLLISMKLDHWKYFDQIMKLLKINREQFDLQYDIIKLYEYQLLSYFKKGLQMEIHLKNYTESLIKSFGTCSFNICVNTQYQKTCLQYFVSEFLSFNWENENYKNQDAMALFSTISKYNKYIKKNKIEIPDWMIETIICNIMRIEKYEDWKQDSILQNLNDDSLKERVFPRIHLKCIHPSILIYMLKYHPMEIVNNIDNIIKAILHKKLTGEYKIFIQKSRLYSSFGLPKKIVKICLSVLRGEDKHSRQPNTLRILCLLLSSKEFLQIISKYYPKPSDSLSLHGLQEEIALCLKYMNEPSYSIEAVKKFAFISNYLKCLDGSIEIILMHTSEKNICNLAIQWNEFPISIKMHFLRTYFKVAKKEAKSKLIKDLMPKERKYVMRVLFLEQGLNFFFNSSCEESFQILQFIMNELTSKDTLTIDKMFNLDKVSDKFLPRYIELLWRIIGLKEGAMQVKDKSRIISLIDKYVLPLLNEELCESLLTQIFTLQDLENSSLLKYACSYLLYSNNRVLQSSRLDKTMLFFKSVVGGHWNNYNLYYLTVFPVRRLIYNFVKLLCDESRDRTEIPLDPSGIFKELKMHLLSVIPQNIIFEELLMIDFSIEYHQTFSIKGKINHELFANFTKSFTEKHSKMNDYYLLNILQKAIPYDILEDDEMFLLNETLLSYPSQLCNIIGIQLIYINKKVNQKIMELILKNPNASVKTFACALLKCFESDVYLENINL